MSDGIIAATARTLRTLADGSVRLSVDFEPMDRARVMELFGEPGSPLAVARLTQEAAQAGLMRNQSTGSGLAQSEAQKASTALYGPQAQKLRQSGFFRIPDVWRAIGGDAEFLDYVRTQDCCAKGRGGCAGDVVAAHVRRIADGAGGAIKPAYAAVPLCDTHHHAQHQHGESALGGKEWFDKQRIEYVEAWAWSALKAKLGFAHWSDIHPHILFRWADKHDLARHLPAEYRV